MGSTRLYESLRQNIRDSWTKMADHYLRTYFGPAKFGFIDAEDMIILLEEAPTQDEQEDAFLNGETHINSYLWGPHGWGWLLKANEQGLIKSFGGGSDSGLAISLIESCIAGQIGATIRLRAQGQTTDDVLFGSHASQLVVTVAPDNFLAFQELAAQAQSPAGVIGKVGGESLSITVASRQWNGPEERELLNLSLKELELEWKNNSFRRMD